MFGDTDDFSTDQVEDKEHQNKWIVFYRQRSRFSWKRLKGKWSSLIMQIYVQAHQAHIIQNYT